MNVLAWPSCFQLKEFNASLLTTELLDMYIGILGEYVREMFHIKALLSVAYYAAYKFPNLPVKQLLDLLCCKK